MKGFKLRALTKPQGKQGGGARKEGKETRERKKKRMNERKEGRKGERKEKEGIQERKREGKKEREEQEQAILKRTVSKL